MTIRHATPDDATSIKKLLIQLGYDTLTEPQVREKISRYNEPPYALLVSTQNEEVTGFISLHWFDIFHSPGKIGRITAFCVDEKSRSSGIGKEMMKAVETFFVSQGCTKLEVTSNIRRERTHDFYLRLGYSEDSRRFVKYY